MKKLFLLLWLAIALQANAASLVTVNWAAGYDNGLALSNGSPLPVGNEVRIGTFNIPQQQVTSLLQAGNLTALAQHFSLFGTTTIGSVVAGSDLESVPPAQRAGLFSAQTKAEAVASISGQHIYLWAFQTSSNGLVSSDYSNVLQTGLFTSSIADWNFPLDGSAFDSVTIELTQLTDGANTLEPSANILYGSFGTGLNPVSNAPNFNLATVVPEPSTAIAALLGGSALLLRRRRKN